MRFKFRWTIENKILVPFLLITLLTILAFGAIIYYTGYTIKADKELELAQIHITYIESDINSLCATLDATEIAQKYQNMREDNIVIYSGSGEVISDGRIMPEGAAATNERILLERSSNLMGWQICYVINQSVFVVGLLEEQKYTILTMIVLLMIIVQASILIAANISMPIQRLGIACAAISAQAEDISALDIEYTNRRDEIGQLAVSFNRMLANIQTYTADIVKVKQLNEGIVESLPIAVVAYDNDKNVMLINTPAKRLLERTDYRNGDKTLAELLTETVEHPRLFYDPIHLTNAEDQGMDIELGVWQLNDESQCSWGVLCTLDDITYKKIMDERISEDNRLIYAGKLAAGLAHEIRNPLAGIRASVQVVKKRLPQEIDQMLCESILGEVDRVNLLVENLLNLSRQRTLRKKMINIPKLYEELILLYSKVAENSHIEIQIQCAAGIALYADESAIKQIFINLINNSIKAIRGSGRIVLGAARPVGRLVLTLTDDGVGIEPKILQQLSKPGNGAAEGGLGLSIVNQLLHQNNGTLKIESGGGGIGTIISMTFVQEEA